MPDGVFSHGAEPENPGFSGQNGGRAGSLGPAIPFLNGPLKDHFENKAIFEAFSNEVVRQLATQAAEQASGPLLHGVSKYATSLANSKVFATALAKAKGTAASVGAFAHTVPAVTVRGSSRRLAANLLKAGVKRPARTAANHIVAHGSPKAAEARRILARHGIDIDAAENGVFLRNSLKSRAPGMYHPSLHTNVYYDTVNERLGQAKSRAEAIRVLKKIRAQLISKEFPR